MTQIPELGQWAADALAVVAPLFAGGLVAIPLGILALMAASALIARRH